MRIDASSLFPKENRTRNQSAKTIAADAKIQISEALKSALLSMGTTELNGEISVEEKLAQILNNASLENNEANADLVQALFKNQMPLNKEMLSSLNRYAKRFPEAELDHILFLMKNDLIVSKESLQFVKELMNNQVDLSGQIQDLSQELSDTIDTPIGKRILETIFKDNPEASKVFDKVKQVLLKINPLQIISKFAAKDGAVQDHTVQESVAKESKSLIDLSKAVQHNTAATSSMDTGPMEEALDFPLTRVMDEGSAKEIVKLVKSSETPMISGVKELFQTISEMELPEDVRDATQKLLAHRITFAMLKKELTISEKELKENDGLRNFYQKLYHKVVDLLKLNLEDPSQELAKLTKEAMQVKNSIEMMNSLQQNYQFMHIPLFLHQQDVDAQLYVMNRKGRAEREGESVTVLLRLDFRNLKQMDIYVKKAKDQVEMTFYVENEETLSDIKSNSIKLHKALMEKAFHVVGLFVQLKSEAFQINEDFFNAKSGQVYQQSFTFDAKA